VTEAQARLRAIRNQDLGAPLGGFIAKLALPDDTPVIVGPVGSTGHCNLTAERTTLLAARIAVVAV
jgi:hypothetical protein